MVDKLTEILKNVDVSEPILEIAPFHSPILPKTEYPKVLTLDVFDTEELRKRAKNDPNTKDHVDRIEEVDFVGNACDIQKIIEPSEHYGKFQNIVSSHNFEHLPNPIKFLIGCSNCLRPGGYLTMAIPDYRACFDHFRFPSRLSDWLSAYYENREQPSPETLFDFSSHFSVYRVGENGTVGCNLNTDEPDKFELEGDIRDSFETYDTRKKEELADYIDAHCNVVTNRSFQLLVSDLVRIGLLNMEIVEISEVNGLEFYVHLRKPDGTASTAEESNEMARASREELLKEISGSLGRSGYTAKRNELDAEMSKLQARVAALTQEVEGLSGERDQLARDLRSVVRHPWKNVKRFAKRK